MRSRYELIMETAPILLELTSGSRVVVTGAAGFIGSRLVEKLRLLGPSVVGVDQLKHFDERPQMRNLDLAERVDRNEFEAWLNRNPDISAVYHMGACSATTQFDVDYLKQVNVEYTKTIWNICAEKKIPFIYASSAATYGGGECGYSDDESRLSDLRPLNPYGDSKQEVDLWVLEQERRGIVPPVWSGFKFFNVYGFREEHKFEQASVVYKAYCQIRDKGKTRLFKSHKSGIEDGYQKRDFIFIDDVIDVLLFAYQKPIVRGIFNLGTGKARSFVDLVQATFKAMNKEPLLEFIDTPESIRDKYQYFTQAEMSRLRGEGYERPFTSLESGVKSYVDWLQKNEEPFGT